MKSKETLFFLIFLFIVVIGGFLYFSNKQSVMHNISLTTVPTAATPITSANPSKCHAIQIDPSDPQAFLPDPACTPGEIDPAVTEDNLQTTICHSGYTQTIRPPVSYTNKLKKQQISDYGYQDIRMGDYEEDHFISLELGGSPTDPKNLWPEYYSFFRYGIPAQHRIFFKIFYF